MIFRRTIQIPCIVEFWNEPGVELHRVDDHTWTGRRGSLRHPRPNDPTTWRTRITIETTPDVAFGCALDVSSWVVPFTEWNRHGPEVELDLFAEYVAGGAVDMARLGAAVDEAQASAGACAGQLLPWARGPRRVHSQPGLQDWVLWSAASVELAIAVIFARVAYAHYHEWVARTPDWLLHTPGVSRQMLAAAACGPVAPSLLAVAMAVAAALTLARRCHSARCLSAEQVAAQFGTTPEEAQRTLSERGVKPRFIVDGLPVYDPAHVTDAGLLLRPADPPAAETLLRVAASGDQSDPSDLLRPAGDGARTPAHVATATPPQSVEMVSRPVD